MEKEARGPHLNALRVVIRVYVEFFSALYASFRLKKSRLDFDSSSKEVWLIEGMFNFPSFFNIYYYLKASLGLGKKPKLIFISTRLRFYRSHKRIRSKIMNMITQNRFLSWPWMLMYNSVYSSGWRDLARVQPSSQDKQKAQKIIATLRTKKDLEEVKVEDILVGDLIYDTYMRFKPAPTVDLKDPFLLELMEFTVAAIPFLRSIFQTEKISHLLTVYTSYIQHGLPSRVALSLGISGHALGTSHQLVSRPTLEFPWHMRNYHRYQEWFASQPNREKNLARGKEIIETRLSGKLNKADYYMSQSAFAAKSDPEIERVLDDLRQDKRKKFVFMCHDFFDSPHGAKWMLFPDFSEWLQNSLKFAKESPYQIVVKPHPNSGLADEYIFTQFKKQYPEVTFLPKKTSNQSLKEFDIAYIATVYGTVTYEFAAMGYDVLCCGDNPHADYQFSILVREQAVWENILTGKEKPRANIDMNEIYEFLYVQHYRYDRGEMSPFFWDFEMPEMFRLIENDENRTALMMQSIRDVDTI